MKQARKNSFISYVLSGQLWWCNIKRILKIKSANLCKTIYEVINYFTSICPFESGRGGEERKKLQKFEYLESEKSFLAEIKIIFHIFEGLSFDEKIKIW